MTTQKENKETETVKKELPLIYGRLADIQAKIPAVGKNDKNEAQHYNYRSIDSILDAVHKLLASNRVFISPAYTIVDRQILERIQNEKVVGKTILVCLSATFKFNCADDLSFLEIGPILSEAADTGDKACMKAQSMALKACLIQTFSIPVINAYDTDGNSDQLGDTGKVKDVLKKPTSMPTPDDEQEETYKSIRDAVTKENSDITPDIGEIAEWFWKLKGRHVNGQEADKILLIARHYLKEIKK